MQVSQIFKDFKMFYQLSFFTKKRFNSIGSRLLVLVLAVSSFFVVFQTLVQLNNEYEVGINEIDGRFEQLNLSYSGSLSRSIWEVNTQQIVSTIEGMRELPDVLKVSVREDSEDAEHPDGALLAEVGEIGTSDYLQKSMPIMINNREEEIKIGTLIVSISLESLYEDLYGTVIFILIFQMFKTFMMSAFILGIFHFLVTRHLITMAEFANDISEHNLDDYLELNRKVVGEEDEIAAMLKAINSTKRNLRKLVKTSEDSYKMQIEIEQQEEREKTFNRFKQEIEAKNEKLALSNLELEEAFSELKSTQDKLINSEKMAALGGMVQGVAHELNTPIGLSITAASHVKSDTERLTELLSDNKMKKSDLDDYLDSTANLSKSIGISLDKAAKLIRSFKLVSVEQHEEHEQTFNVHSNLADILYSVNPSLKDKKITFINSIPEDISIRSFPGVFYQMYTNFINNSILHGFEGRDNGVIEVKANYQDNMLDIVYSDNGKGMNEEVLKKVFDPFFTTKRANGGPGLGMNIIYNLVHDKLLGTIKVSSEEGAGAQYHLQIPNINSHSEN
jgi:signal transduction histidine kinase